MMTNNIEISGRAISVLCRQFRDWEHTMAWITENGTMKRWHIASKCKALIMHDRIIRGEKL